MTKLAKILVIPVHKREPPTERRDRAAPLLLVVVVLGALGLYWAGAFLSRSQEVAEVRTLSPETRRNLVTRTLDELGTICRGPAAATGILRDHCVQQAHFLLLIPECGDACQRAAVGVLPHSGR